MEDSIDPKEDYREAEDRFYIGSTSNVRDLKDVIYYVEPQEIYFFSPYARQYAKDLRNFAP